MWSKWGRLDWMYNLGFPPEQRAHEGALKGRRMACMSQGGVEMVELLVWV